MTDIEAPDPPQAPGPGTPLSATSRTRHGRLREQGRTDRIDLLAVLRAGLIAHLGVRAQAGFMVVPTSYGFDDEYVYVHGSVVSQSLAGDMPEVCLTVTIVALPAGLAGPPHVANRQGNEAHPR